MGTILNGQYESAAELTLASKPTRKYISFERTDLACEYASVTMGAGDQRLFDMLRMIERTRDNPLISIDEIDLLLHGDALTKLIGFLFEHCTDKSKRVVFTSHREELLAHSEWINIRHIHRASDRHRCFPSTDPDSLHRLTGNRVRPLEIFVEDPLSEAIAHHVASTLRLSKHVQVIRFGSATNCFSLLAGLMLKGETCENSLFVLDGDIYRDPEERATQIGRACSGNDARATLICNQMPGLVADYVLPAGIKPEPFIHSLIIGLDRNSLLPPELEIRSAADGIVNPTDLTNLSTTSSEKWEEIHNLS